MRTAAQPESRRRGRRGLLTEDRRRLLAVIAAQLPRSSLDDLTREFNRRTGLDVCSATVRKGLRLAGVTRLRPERKPAERAVTRGRAPPSFGYRDLRMGADGAIGTPTDLTDTEWALGAALFERKGGRGVPPTHPRRVLVNACLYVVRTGCAWRRLPRDAFPPWQAAYEAFRRWTRAGVFEAMHDRLRQQWRDRLGRAPDNAAVFLAARAARSAGAGRHDTLGPASKARGASVAS